MSDIRDLQSQIDGLKNGKIATVEQQIASIQATISAMQSDRETFGADIEKMRKYIDDEIGKLKNWETATFATLELYQDVLRDLEEQRFAFYGLCHPSRKICI